MIPPRPLGHKFSALAPAHTLARMDAGSTPMTTAFLIGRVRGVKRWIQLLWLLVPALALVEVGHHVWIESRVPDSRDWQQATRLVEAGRQAGDLVVISPWWASQGFIWLGRFVTVEQMAREDDEGYGRIWEVALPGHRQEGYEKKGKLLKEDRAGCLTVRLWSFPRTPATLFDFVEQVETRARVSMVPSAGGPEEPCVFRANPKTGLVPNAAVQGGKFRCDQRLAWNYVAREVIADLDNRPRLCLWAHPIDGKRIVIEFSGVPEGGVIEGHTGKKYEADREHVERPPILLQVNAAGKTVGTAMHVQGGGWMPYSFDLGPEGTAGKVTFEVSSAQAGMAHFCFTAKLRDE